MSLSEAPSAAGPSRDRSGRGAILWLAVAATFLAVLSTNIVNVALPQLMVALGATVAEAEWVVTAYMVTFALVLPVSGWFADQVGRARTFYGALLVFVAGAVVAACAPSVGVLIAGRVVQAIGASALGPTAMGLIHENFLPHERGRALGLWSAGATLGPSLGPTIGGLLVESVGWRAIFVLYVPVGLLVLVFALRTLPRASAKVSAGAFDGRGFAGSMAFFGGLLLGIHGLSHGLPRFAVAGLALASMGIVTLLLKGARRGPDAFIDLAVLLRRGFSAALAVGAIRSFALFGSIFLLPLYLQHVGGVSPVKTALLLIAGPLSVAAGSPLAGRLIGRVDTRLLAVMGVLLVSGSLFWLNDLTAVPVTTVIVGSQVLRGLGISLLLSPVMAAALNEMPGEQVGRASGLVSITMQLGGAVGIAVLSGALLHFCRRQGIPGPALHSAAAAAAFSKTFAVGGWVNLLGLVSALRLSPNLHPQVELAPARSR